MKKFLTDKSTEELMDMANPSNPEAQFELGRRYFEGDGIPQNVDSAIYWWCTAALNNCAEAQYIVARISEGFDDEYAVLWCRKAAAQGHTEAQALLEALEASISESAPDSPIGSLL